MDDFDFVVGDMVGWSSQQTGQPYRGEILRIYGPPYPRAVIRMAGRSVKKEATSVVSLSLLVHAGPKRNHRRDATNMTTKDDLIPIPKGKTILCYRCKRNGHDVPAAMCKEMRTPNGSKYYRGWCDSCLTTSAARWEPPNARPKQVHTLDRPFRPGEMVNVHFTGKILHYVARQPENVVIQVGRQGFNVKIKWVEKAIEKGDVND